MSSIIWVLTSFYEGWKDERVGDRIKDIITSRFLLDFLPGNYRSSRIAEQSRKAGEEFGDCKAETMWGKGTVCEIFQLQITGLKEFMVLVPQVLHFINAHQRHFRAKLVLCCGNR